MEFKLTEKEYDILPTWAYKGWYYGYPDCCVGEFIANAVKGISETKPRKFHGTGYVPCTKCNKKTEKQLLKKIAKNRKHPKPFPNDSEL